MDERRVDHVLSMSFTQTRPVWDCHRTAATPPQLIGNIWHTWSVCVNGCVFVGGITLLRSLGGRRVACGLEAASINAVVE